MRGFYFWSQDAIGTKLRVSNAHVRAATLGQADNVDDPDAVRAELINETEAGRDGPATTQTGSEMTTTSRKYQELSLEQQIQRVRDAWFARPSGPGSDPG